MRYAGTLVAAFFLAMAGCGGGGGSGGGSVPQDAAVGGIWEGTATVAGQGTFQVIGLVAEDGRAHFIQEDGVQYWGTMQASGSRVTASFTGATEVGTTFLDGSTSGSGTLNGTIQERRQLSASTSFTTTAGTRTTSTLSLTYNSLYDRDSSLATISGNYTNWFAPGSDAVNVSSNGTLFGQDPSTGCVYNGRVQIVDPNYNAYTIEYSYSSCTGAESALNGATFRGIATLDTTVSPNVAIAGLQGSIQGALYSLVFIYQRT